MANPPASSESHHKRFGNPVNQQVLSLEPENALAHLWLGKLGAIGSKAHFQRAFQLDPANDEARGRFCLSIIGHVGFNQHHLPDTYFNDAHVDLADLLDAEALWADNGQSQWANYCLLEIAELRKNAEAWLLRQQV